VSGSGPTALGGLALAPETGGASLVVSAGAVGASAAGSEMAAGAAKNSVAVANVIAYKAGGRFSPQTKADAKAAAEGKCSTCKVETSPSLKSEKGVKRLSSEGTTDHIEPRSKGGTNAPSNADHKCLSCNLKKSDN
jgi:hypothetical protein